MNLSLAVPLGLALVSLTYPFAIWATLRSPARDVLRWIQNSPSFCVFAIFLLPLAAWLTLPDMLRFGQQVEGPWYWWSLAILAAFLLIVVFGVRFEVRQESHAGPFIGPRKDVRRRLEDERAIRDEIRGLMADLRTASGEVERRAILDKIDQRKQDHFRSRPAYSGIFDMLLHGTLADLSSYLVNLVCVGFAAIVLWHVFNVLALDLPGSGDRLLLAVGLMILWFPMRLYAEWYNNFFSLNSFNAFYAGIGLLEAAIVVYVMLVIKENPQIGIRAFAAAITGVFGAGIAIGKIKPRWLSGVADIVEGTPFGWWVAYVIIGMVGFFGSIKLLLTRMGIG